MKNIFSEKDFTARIPDATIVETMAESCWKREFTKLLPEILAFSIHKVAYVFGARILQIA